MIKEAWFRFHGSLNDFLPKEKRDVFFPVSFFGKPNVKDLMESAGVPHPEVDAIRMGEESVGFDRMVQPGDRIEAFPAGSGLESRVRSEALSEFRFVLDGHLAKLASGLRMLGFDSAWRNPIDDAELAGISARENRILLTRDVGCLKRGVVRYGYWVREVNPREQLQEILLRFDLRGRVHPFTRCLKCNGMLGAASRDEVLGRVPEPVAKAQERFYRCETCGQIYWEGSHFDRMSEFVSRLSRNPIR